MGSNVFLSLLLVIKMLRQKCKNTQLARLIKSLLSYFFFLWTIKSSESTCLTVTQSNIRRISKACYLKERKAWLLRLQQAF